MDKNKKQNIANFGKYGWLTIFYCMLMFWFYVGMVNDGTNATAPAIASKLGVELGVILNANAVGGVLGIIIFIIAGQLNKNIGSRMTSSILLILAGGSYIFIGNATSLIMYTGFYTLLVGSVMSAGYVSGGTLVAIWFPKCKGIVMGYTTMGHNLASALYVPIIVLLVSKYNVSNAVIPIGIACAILGVLGYIFVRNTPQERGVNPDNVSNEVFKNEYDLTDVTDDGGWTTSKLLKTKELWVAAITTGCFQICSTGVMTTMVIRNGQLGFSQVQAVTIMSICAFIGVVGSWIIGIFDDKFGTRRTMIVFGIWYAAALLCNASEVTPLVYLSIGMIGMGIGGSANFTTSLPSSIFGRHGFNKVNSVLFPIQGAISSLCFAVNGVISLITGGELRWSYAVFAGVALCSSLIVSTINDKKYNRDFLAEQKLNSENYF